MTGFQYVLQGLLISSLIGIFIPVLQATPEIETRLQPSHNLKRGETCLFQIAIAWPSAEAQYGFVLPEFSLRHLTLEEIGETNETFYRDGEEWKRKTFLAKLEARETGQGGIGALQITYLDPASQKGGRLEVPLKNFDIQPDPADFYRPLASVLMALGAGITAFGWISRRQKDREKREGASLRLSIEEQRSNELESLKDTPDFSKIARIFQSYLCSRHSIPDNEQMTCFELIGRLEGKVGDEELRKLKNLVRKLEEKRFSGITNLRADDGSQLRDEIIRFMRVDRVISV